MNDLDAYSNKMIAAFVGKPEKTFWYQNAFSTFNVNGVDAMKWRWSWWAFGGGFLFLLYRKQYIPSLALLVASFTVGMIPFVGLILAVDRILDMSRTAVNVWSDSTCALVVARLEGETPYADETTTP